jgi:hypothetical protein
MPVRATFKDTLAPLAQLAQERSLIGADLSIGAGATVADLLVEPRFWPVPNREAVEKSLDRDQRPKPVDVIDAPRRAAPASLSFQETNRQESRVHCCGSWSNTFGSLGLHILPTLKLIAGSALAAFGKRSFRRAGVAMSNHYMIIQ